MKKPVCSDTYELSELQVHRLSKETIYLPTDIIKCSVITVLLRFYFFLFFLARKSLFSHLPLKCCISAFVNSRKVTAASLQDSRLTSPRASAAETTSVVTRTTPTHKICQRGKEEGPGWHFLPLTSDPALLEAQCDRGGAATSPATLVQ